MIKESSIINILTYKLDYKLARQIYSEYQNRLRDAKFKIETYKTYQVLKADLSTVELLLALSIFHKRVIANIDAAAEFYDIINSLGGANTVKMGTYSLTGHEKNKILGVTEELVRKLISFGWDTLEVHDLKGFHGVKWALQNHAKMGGYLK